MNVDWNQLEACGGATDASKIPTTVPLLFSSDDDERKNSYWGIDNHAVVQGDLYSSAPYAARMIIDVLKDRRVVTLEVVDILYELHNGSGTAMLRVGPLAGETLEALCRAIVKESAPLLVELRPSLTPELLTKVSELLETIEEKCI